MSARAGDWGLFGEDGDPLPGDAYDVATEARHYADTAEAIRDQVARLRTLATGSNELVGKYAPELRESAKDLADHLEKAEGRFDAVAEQLHVWQPVLEDGMTQSLSLLRQAEHEKATLEASRPPSTAPDPQDTAAQHAEQQRASRHAAAAGSLASLVSRFRSLMSGVNHSADSVARAIEDASHDSLKDSWWDSHVRKWIHDNATLLKFIADVLTWVATAIVVAVVLLSNPAGWLILAAMAFTAAALLIHSTLAANGDGSWVDVALDAFALVTMGGGKIVTTLARGARSARLVAAGLGEGAEAFGGVRSAARAALADSSGLGKVSVWLRDANPVTGVMEGASAFKNAYLATVRRALPEDVTWLSRVLSGSKEDAALYKDFGLLADKYGPGFLLNTGSTLTKAGRGLFVSGAAVDFTFKGLNDAGPLGDGTSVWHGLRPWVAWKEEHTVPVSPAW